MFDDRSGERDPQRSPCNLLFLCTHNSARSLMAEAILNRRSFSLDRPSLLRGFSAGDHPAEHPHPMAMELLRGFGYATAFAKPMDWRRFARAGAPEIHLIVLVCDRDPDPPAPAFETPPVFLRWPTPDPAAEAGDLETRRRAFMTVYRTLEKRIDALQADLTAHGPLELTDQDRIRRRLGALGALTHADADLAWPA